MTMRVPEAPTGASGKNGHSFALKNDEGSIGLAEFRRVDFPFGGPACHPSRRYDLATYSGGYVFDLGGLNL